MSNGFYEGNVQEESEGFLSLEDEAAPPLEIKQRKPRKPLSKLMKPLFDSFAPDESESMDMLVLGEYSGNQSICWPIQDMDCPHCASEARNALNRLKHLKT